MSDNKKSEKGFGEEVVDAAEQVGKVALKGAAGIIKGGIKATTFAAKKIGEGISNVNEKKKQKKAESVEQEEE